MMKAKKDLKVILTIRVHQELKARIDKILKDHAKMDQSDLLRRAVEIGLDEMKLVGYDPEVIYRATIAEAKAKKNAQANTQTDCAPTSQAKRPLSAKNRISTLTETPDREPVHQKTPDRNGHQQKSRK
jgi:predicted DNA-binding protein